MSDSILQFTHVEMAIVCVGVIGLAIIVILAMMGVRDAR